MAVIDVKCPMCKETNVIKFGTNTTGKQRYKCKNEYCAKDTLTYFPKKIPDNGFDSQLVGHEVFVICFLIDLN